MRLIGLLAPYIEKAATRQARCRSPQLLALGDEALARAAAGPKAERLLEQALAEEPDDLRAAIGAARCWAICCHHDLYPEGLRDAADAPAALLGRGEPERLANLRREATVTVVGARRATSYGREIARGLAAQLAGAGFAVVSGMALGIDGAAHEGALETGLTVAVLGCGADVLYPRHHYRLYERVREQGLLLSELPPRIAPWRWAFPARNRIMAALGAMTIVVEAARQSGSLITADLAGELGREVGAVPGPVGSRSSAGTNALIADGARLVRDAEDVLDALIGPGRSRRPPGGVPLDEALAALLERVELGDSDPDAIATAVARRAAEVSAGLLRLELMGYVRRSFAGSYVRTALPRPQSPVL
jgi:DNA processing protein